MAKLDPVVKKETVFIAWSSLLCSLLVQLVFLLCREWDISVLWGGILGWLLCVSNFFLMSRDIQLAVETGDESQAKLKIRSSYTWRTLLMLAAVIVSLIVNCIHWIPVVASVFFPRIVISIRQIVERLFGKKEPEIPLSAAPTQESHEPDEQEDGFEKILRHFGDKITPDYTAASRDGESADAPSSHDKQEGSES